MKQWRFVPIFSPIKIQKKQARFFASGLNSSNFCLWRVVRWQNRWPSFCFQFWLSTLRSDFFQNPYPWISFTKFWIVSTLFMKGHYRVKPSIFELVSAAFYASFLFVNSFIHIQKCLLSIFFIDTATFNFSIYSFIF